MIDETGARDASLIRVEGVSKTYTLGKRRVEALHDIDLSLSEGEFIAIAGPSGSGKSTLLNLLGCLDLPTSGRIFLHDQDISTMEDHEQAKLRNRFIGFVFQSFNLIPVLSAFENVEYPLVLLGLPRNDRRQRVEAVLTEVGLSEHAAHRPDYLSGGQRQRVAIARALVTQPKLVLADEPTANLDSKTGGEIIALMRTLNREHRTTFVFSTHDPRVVSQAEHVYRIEDGRLQA
uniref:Putative ABC transport system ATP-binding protein n=2 Tax=unclassified Candidatus Kentrum TaxID=2643149 RepID=A0A451AAV9_9GAMM|nr:MAG: putative ABC transport system ATP-binding protein [Candidatus Kentron sp. LPFa]VFK63166.1 MAG: putative ABC transport system ATP-binding protein [Candidatus Kentron sp. UNK]VFK71383.1 MAG: putative ABC transport system ATP-binding protein [Candidatus Kentron sp. UNK]